MQWMQWQPSENATGKVCVQNVERANKAGKRANRNNFLRARRGTRNTPPACCVLPPLHGSSGAIGTPTNLGLGRNSPAVTGFLSPVQGYSEFLVPRLFLSQASHRSLLAKNDD